MPAIRMLSPEVPGHAIEPVNLRCGVDHRVHAASLEIRVTERRADKDVPGRQCADQFVKIERNIV